MRANLKRPLSSPSTLFLLFIGFLATFNCSAKPSSQEGVSPAKATQYFFKNGATTHYQGINAGDPRDWTNLIHNLNGSSASGKVSISPGSYESQRDAMLIEWKKCCDMGVVAIYGENIDLSSRKNNSALRFDAKVHSPPSLGVFVGMDCNHPCEANYTVTRQLKNAKLDSPITVSIPLSCLHGDNFDLSKVNGVFKISTAGELKMTITNIRVESLPKNELTCP